MLLFAVSFLGFLLFLFSFPPKVQSYGITLSTNMRANKTIKH